MTRTRSIAGVRAGSRGPRRCSARWRGRVAMATLRNWRCAAQRKGPPWIKVGAKVLYPTRELRLWEAAMRRAPGLEL
ncbi:MAG: DNA-binding protein [Alphaproteobacteria bacterium]|nr:DNA-binding protein [Alphaproteobacteria bacterium]